MKILTVKEHNKQDFIPFYYSFPHDSGYILTIEEDHYKWFKTLKEAVNFMNDYVTEDMRKNEILWEERLGVFDEYNKKVIENSLI